MKKITIKESNEETITPVIELNIPKNKSGLPKLARNLTLVIPLVVAAFVGFSVTNQKEGKIEVEENTVIRMEFEFDDNYVTRFEWHTEPDDFYPMGAVHTFTNIGEEMEDLELCTQSIHDYWKSLPKR